MFFIHFLLSTCKVLVLNVFGYPERIIKYIYRILCRITPILALIWNEILVVVLFLVHVVVWFDQFLIALFLFGSGPERVLPHHASLLLLHLSELFVDHLDVLHSLSHLSLQVNGSLTTHDTLLQSLFVSIVFIITLILV